MNVIKKSKRLSYILRHNPKELEAFGGFLNNEGYVDVSSVLSLFNITITDLDYIVNNNNKKRFKFNKNKTKIKANQGHTIKVELNLLKLKPPKVLYHGSATRFHNSIKDEGLCKMKRHHVHMSENKDVAKDVGKRYGKLLLFSIDSAYMYKEGFNFYKTDNDVWLVNHVPYQYLTIQEELYG